MNLKLTALVLGVSGNVSIAILKAIRQANFADITIFGACIRHEAAGFALCDEALLSPAARSPDFASWLKETVATNNINLVISGVEEVNAVLAELKAQQGNAQFLVPEIENVQRFHDKLKTMQWFDQHGIDHPKTVDLDDADAVGTIESTLEFPVIVKPRHGKGSLGVAIVADAAALRPYIALRNHIAQEHVGTPDQEYTCGVYKSKFGYTQIVVMRRMLHHGSTSCAEVVRHPAIEAYCERIAAKLNTTAPFNIQLRLTADGTPKCFEINMRLSGTTAMRHRFGFRDCEAWIREQLFDKDARSIFNLQPGVAIRYEEEAYFKGATLESLSLTTPRRVKELLK